MGATIACRKTLSNLDPGIEELTDNTASKEFYESESKETDRKRIRTLTNPRERFSKSHKGGTKTGEESNVGNFEVSRTSASQRTEFRNKRFIEQKERIKQLKQEGPNESFEQYKTIQLKHYLKINRCAVSGNKGSLVKRLRLALQEL